MAKGRRLTTSRSERYLGVSDYDNHYGHVPYNGDVSEVSEFGEEDIWSMVEHAPDHHHHNQASGYEASMDSVWTSRASTESGRRWDVSSQHDTRQVGGLSLAFEDGTTSYSRIVHQFGGAGNTGSSATNISRGPRVGKHMATSAPVNVPDWSKILRVDSSESTPDSDEDDRVGDTGMEPPHEYLARSRSKMNAFSVYEGVGRTLKGRDMSRVRDAVWSQTGFEG